MAVDPGQVEQVYELFGALGLLRTRRMFGGLSVYCDELFFALADDRLIYVEVDADTSDPFEAAGSELNVMSYRRLHATAYDEPEEAQASGRPGVEAAMRAKPARKRKA